jgi:hypothetical protein
VQRSNSKANGDGGDGDDDSDGLVGVASGVNVAAPAISFDDDDDDDDDDDGGGSSSTTLTHLSVHLNQLLHLASHPPKPSIISTYSCASYSSYLLLCIYFIHPVSQVPAI